MFKKGKKDIVEEVTKIRVESTRLQEDLQRLDKERAAVKQLHRQESNTQLYRQCRGGPRAQVRQLMSTLTSSLPHTPTHTHSHTLTHPLTHPLTPTHTPSLPHTPTHTLIELPIYYVCLQLQIEEELFRLNSIADRLSQFIDKVLAVVLKSNCHCLILEDMPTLQRNTGIRPQLLSMATKAEVTIAYHIITS